MVLVNRPCLQKVSRDLFFGVCHFCSFEIANLADSPKFPEKYFFVCEINSIKIVYLFIIYSNERPVWAILLNDVDCIKGPTSTPEVMINHH